MPLQIMDNHRKKSQKTLVRKKSQKTLDQNLEAPKRLKKANTLVANLEPPKRLIVVLLLCLMP